MKYRVIKDSDTFNITIIVEDGGIASVYDNGTNILTEYFGTRLDEIEGEDVWNELAEGKIYIKEWEDTISEEEIIADALDWLVCPPPDKWEIDNTIYEWINIHY